MRKTTALVSVATMVAAFAVAVGVQVFLTAGAAAAGCPPDPYTYWDRTTVSYSVIGPTGGEHNGGDKEVPFDYTLRTDTTASTSVSAGASFTIDAGIASVQAELKVTVTKTMSKGTSITGHLWIPAHQSGSLQPKAQYGKFTRYRVETTPQCGTRKTNLGSMRGITKVPYFSSCIGSDSCVPKP